MKIETKFCPDCKKDKLLKAFRIEIKKYKDKEYRYSRFRCRDCDNLFQRTNYPRYRKMMKISRKKYFENNPWLKHYFNIKLRCRNPKAVGYKYYGGKGIKSFLTIQGIKQLWFRDKANEMDHPHIHRENNNEHYTFSNCSFIERRDHPKKKVLQIEPMGKAIRKYESVSEAAKEMNTTVSNISQALTGKLKTAKRFRWEYA